MTKQKNKRKILIIASVALLAVLAIGLSIGLSSAKYRTEKVMQGNVKFTAELAEGMKLLEHQIVRATDGSYDLNTNNPVATQNYMLMPGVDVPKDPYVTIQGKTNIPAYLYVEILETGIPYNTDSPEPKKLIDYSVSGEWTLVEGVTGLLGGDVYVYNTILTKANTTDETEFKVFDEDDGNTLIVSQDLPRGTSATLEFYAYICQVVEGDPAADFVVLGN